MSSAHLIVGKGERPPFLVRAYRLGAPVRRWLNQHLTVMTEELITMAYECGNQNLHTMGLQIGKSLRRLHKTSLIGLESDVVRLIGIGKGDGKPLSVLYLGDEVSLKFLIYTMFADGSVERFNLGRCLTTQMLDAASLLARSNDLVVFERLVGTKWEPPFGEWISTPRWVRMVIDIPPGTTKAEMRSYLNQRQKKNIKKVLNEGIYPIISTRFDDLQFFIEKMHIPTIRTRHGEYAGTPDQKHYLKLAKKGLLLFHCLPDGTRIAGSLNVLRNKYFYAVFCGFLDGDLQWLEKGALAADYLYIIEYAVENGFRRLDCGEVIPILSNGLYNHKKRWGFHTEISPWHVTEWLFWIPGNSQSAWNWIKENPFELQYVSSSCKQKLAQYQVQGQIYI